jgi:gliding motility-associated-like protein
MFKRKCLIFITLILFAFIKGKSQGTDEIWYFGNNAGISFSAGVPSVITNSASTCADITATALDSSGNLLFYTNGVKVWNSTHNVMNGGSNIGGNVTAGNTAVIVPRPGSPNIFYIFTPQAFGGTLKYSVVDMSLSGGLGTVTSTSTILAANLTEKLYVVGNCAIGTHWLLAHGTNSNQYKVFPITSSGIGSPVITSIGYNLSSAVGQIEYCKATSKIAIASYDDNIFEILDFDINTGVLSNPITLPNHFRAWGVTFSPDGTKLYNTQWTYAGVNQFDLNAGSAAAINASNTQVGNVTGPNPTYLAGYLQLGPDNRVYIAKFDDDYVATINNPNNLGLACNFADNSLWLNGKICQAGFSICSSPKIIDSLQFTSVNSCINTPTQFNGPPNLNSYAWNFNDPSSGANNTSTLQNPTHIFSSAGTYQVSLVGIGNCVNDTTIQNITISAPSQTIAPSDTITCQNDSVLVVASGGTTYQWSNGITSTNDSVYIQVFNATQIIVTAINGICPSLPDTFNVSVAPLVSLQVNGISNICQGDSLILIASGNSTGYQWSGLSSSTNDTLAILPSNSGTIYIQGTNLCNSEIDSVNVNVFALPAVNFSNTAPLCANISVAFNYTGNAVLNYLWNFNDTASGIYNTSNLQNPTHNYLTSGTYNVTLIGSNNCGADTISQQIIIPSQTLTIAPSDTITCQNDSLLLVASGGTTYQWSNGITSTNDSVYIQVFNATQIIVTAINGICPSLPDTFNVSVSPVITAQITGPDTLCLGSSISLIASGNSSNYQWTGIINSVNDTTVLSPVSSGMVYLQGTNNICNSEIDSAFISVVSGPVANFNTTGPYCNNANIAFNFIGSSVSSFAWNFDDPNSGNLNTSTLQNSFHNFNQSGIYDVSLIVNNSCGADTLSQNIIIGMGPIVTLPNDTSLCAGQSITLTANAGVVYNWTGDTISNSNAITVSPMQSSIYLLNVSDGFCFGPVDTILISVIQPNAVHIVGENNYCKGDTVVLYGQGATNFSWNAFGNVYSGTSLELISTNSGYVFASPSNANCPGITDSFYVNILPKSEAIFIYDIDTCNNKIIFKNQSQNVTFYNWDFGNGSVSSESDPQIEIKENGNYFITLITNPNSKCADTLSTDFYLDEVLSNNYFIPNTFTPNGDGLNDKFKITTQNKCKYFNLKIYNRWGNLIFSTEGFEVSWDGKFNGREVPEGVYVYLINDGLKEVGGTVTLFK